jgi:cell division protein FtsB
MKKIEKIGFFFTFIILFALLFLILFSRNGIFDYNELLDKEAAITKQIADIKKANKKIEDEIKSLRTDLDYIKHIAKHKHDMAAEDEMIFKSKPEEKGGTE